MRGAGRVCSNQQSMCTEARSECRPERGNQSTMKMREERRVETANILCAWKTGRDIEVSTVAAQLCGEQLLSGIVCSAFASREDKKEDADDITIQK